jgi:hypothetical protein
MDEVRAVVMEALREKAPDPDGFIGLFFASSWDIIKEDIMRAVGQFYMLNHQGLQFLNHVYVVLIKKSLTLKEYQTIGQSASPTALPKSSLNC